MRSDDPAESAPAEPQTVRLQANEMVNVVTEVPEELAAAADAAVAGGGAAGAAQKPVAPREITPPVRKVVFQREEVVEDEIRQFWTEKDFQEEAIDPDRVEEKFPGINARVQRLSEERRQYEELQRLRREGLLGAPQDTLTESVEPIEEEPEREPEQIALGEPRTNDRIERIVLPQEGPTTTQQLRRAGGWMLGVGIAMEIAGLAGAWYVEDARLYDEIKAGGPSTGMMLGGGVFISSGLLSYFASLFTD